MARVSPPRRSAQTIGNKFLQTRAMKPLGRLLFVPFVAFCFISARADVKLPAIFSDHMVLQCDATVPVWGSAEPGEQVTVTVTASANETAKSKTATETRVTTSARSSAQTHTVTADSSGKWS